MGDALALAGGASWHVEAKPLRAKLVDRAEPWTWGSLWVPEEIRRGVARGSPFGDEGWRCRIVQELGLESTQRWVGRPRKTEDRVLERVNAA